MSLPSSRMGAVLALMLASGFAGLGYQIVWTQQSALWLGHEAAAVLAVIAAFFGGLALGALLIGPRIARSLRPVRWYAGCELLIGTWSLALAGLLGPVTAGLLHVIGAQPAPGWHWFIAFGGTFLLLLPATAAMGATMPAMARLFGQWRGPGASIAALYAGNTAGAMLGVLATAFMLIPSLGLIRTAGICAALNVLCATVALKLLADSQAPNPEPPSSAMPGLRMKLAATGLLGIGYEVLVVRVLSQVAENTVYTFAILLAVYLAGTALGAAAYSRWASRDSPTLGDRLLRLLVAACLLGLFSLFAAQDLKSAILHLLGSTMTAALTAEAVLAALVFLLPTVVMGSLFSHLSAQAARSGLGFGPALGINTLGAAAAPLLCGVWLLPALGPKFALLLVAAGYLALSSSRAWSAPSHWAAAAAVVAAAVWLLPLVIVNVPEGGRIASYREGVMAAVSVVEDADGVATLHIDNRQQEGSSASLYADARQALLPMLLHPAPQRALFLGLGTGVTASFAADDPGLQVDVVELLPEVITASSYFAEKTERAEPHSRLHLMAADARRYVRATDTRYDLIVSDNFHPARSGSGALYTVEHFQAVRDRLTADGLFCQWLPLHQLDLSTLRSIVAAFLKVYPQGLAMLATNSLETPTIGLVGRADSSGFDVEALRERLSHIAMPRSPAAFDLNDDFALLGSFIAGPRALAAFAAGAAVNTDDHPVVAYRAPRITYAPDSKPRDRLFALLHELSVSPDELLASPRDIALDARLTAYWTARNRYLEAGRDVRPSADVQAMLAQVQQPLLSVLKLSPDFRPAYDPLLGMAKALARVDSAQACVLLSELVQVQPARVEAGQAARDICGEEPP